MVWKGKNEATTTKIGGKAPGSLLLTCGIIFAVAERLSGPAARGGGAVTATGTLFAATADGELSAGSNCSKTDWVVEFTSAQAARCGVGAMSSRGAGMAGSVVSLEPKANVRSEARDQLDKAGQAILGLLNRAASAAETNYQQAIEMTHKLSAQLRSAEDRIQELEAHVRHHQCRAT